MDNSIILDNSIEKLISMYDTHMEEGYYSPIVIEVLCRFRRGAYRSSSNIELSECKYECEKLITFLECALLDVKCSASMFKTILSAYLRVDIDCGDLLKNEDKLDVLNKVKESLIKVLVILKKHPNKYGYRIRFVKDTLNIVSQNIEEMLQAKEKE